MLLSFSESETLQLTLLDASSDEGFCSRVRIEATSGLFSGAANSEFDHNDIQVFCSELKKLSTDLTGGATLGMEGLSGCFLRLGPLNSTGTFALDATICGSHIQPALPLLRVRFLWYTSQMHEVAHSLEAFFASAAGKP
jgi:hypothetical protein